MAKRKPKRTDIVYKKGHWIAERKGKQTDSAETKTELVDRVAKKARRSRGSSLRIHKRNGQIQEERTYPRASDPVASKG